MRVYYRPAGDGNYEQAGVRFCCDEMRYQWGDIVGFGIRGHSRTVRRVVSIFSTETLSTVTVVPVVVSIGYCPWCGKEIEVVRAT